MKTQLPRGADSVEIKGEVSWNNIQRRQGVASKVTPINIQQIPEVAHARTPPAAEHDKVQSPDCAGIPLVGRRRKRPVGVRKRFLHIMTHRLNINKSQQASEISTQRIEPSLGREGGKVGEGNS